MRLKEWIPSTFHFQSFFLLISYFTPDAQKCQFVKYQFCRGLRHLSYWKEAQKSHKIFLIAQRERRRRKEKSWSKHTLPPVSRRSRPSGPSCGGSLWPCVGAAWSAWSSFAPYSGQDRKSCWKSAPSGKRACCSSRRSAPDMKKIRHHHKGAPPCVRQVPV